jgi:hypothetical protein
MLAIDKAVFDQIREQFRQHAAAWPLRGAGLRKLPELKVGDLVLEVLSGPVAALDKAVLGPFNQSINQCYTCSFEAQIVHASHSLISRS